MKSILYILACVSFFGLSANSQSAAEQGVMRSELIDVGGRKIEIVRGGQGDPTIVVELASPGPRLWNKILPEVARISSTVSYYHLGTGRSDPAPKDRSAQQIVAELRALLKQAGVKPPFVLVGHSMGGLYARVFAITYPGEVAGLVLVDPSHERQVIEWTRMFPDSFPQRRKRSLESLGPPQRAEMDALAPILEKSGTLPGKVPDVPMALLTSTTGAASIGPGAAKIFRELHNEMFESTTYGMHIVTRKSGHHIQTDEPELVLKAIRWVVDAVRAQK
ncbi:MAG TPA: alpha/beta hydrolase [Pyrinomonadaceae bacterium]|nr:alpha/beta hydrolase [Pyrinomonadaceae bacterium]